MVAVDGEPTQVEKRLLDLLVAEVGHEIVSEYTFKLSDSANETRDFF